jgi:hypothetical protein
VEATFPHGRDAGRLALRTPGEAACEAEVRAFMSDHPGAEVLDLTTTETVR